MIMGLKLGPFSDSLCKNPSTTLGKLRARATNFIQMEEMTTFRAQIHKEPSKKQVEREEKIKSGRSRGKSGANRLPQSKLGNYTPLIESQGQVLEEACNAELIQSLAKI